MTNNITNCSISELYWRTNFQEKVEICKEKFESYHETLLYANQSKASEQKKNVLIRGFIKAVVGVGVSAVVAYVAATVFAISMAVCVPIAICAAASYLYRSYSTLYIETNTQHKETLLALAKESDRQIAEAQQLFTCIRNGNWIEGLAEFKKVIAIDEDESKGIILTPKNTSEIHFSSLSKQMQAKYKHILAITILQAQTDIAEKKETQDSDIEQIKKYVRYAVSLIQQVESVSGKDESTEKIQQFARTFLGTGTRKGVMRKTAAARELCLLLRKKN